MRLEKSSHVGGPVNEIRRLHQRNQAYPERRFWFSTCIPTTLAITIGGSVYSGHAMLVQNVEPIPRWGFTPRDLAAHYNRNWVLTTLLRPPVIALERDTGLIECNLVPFQMLSAINGVEYSYTVLYSDLCPRGGRAGLVWLCCSKTVIRDLG